MDQITGQSKHPRFSLVETCVFIFAIAFGMALVKSDYFHVAQSFERPGSHGLWLISVAVLYAIPFLYFFSAMVAARSFISYPRPREETFLQPGIGSCFVVTVCPIPHLLVGVTRKLFYEPSYANDQIKWSSVRFLGEMMDMASQGGYFVVVLWVLLAVAGRGWKRSDWVELLGRFIGLTWIMLLFSPPFQPAY